MLAATSYLLVSVSAGCGEKERAKELLLAAQPGNGRADDASRQSSPRKIVEVSLVHVLQRTMQNPNAVAVTDFWPESSEHPLLIGDLEVIALTASLPEVRVAVVNTLKKWIEQSRLSGLLLVGTWANATSPPDDIVRMFDTQEKFHTPSLDQRTARLRQKGQSEEAARAMAACSPGLSLAKLERMLELGIPLKTAPIQGDEAEWNGIIGYETVKASLTRLVRWRLDRQADLDRMGIEPVSGILLHGPSGCGKTQLALSFAKDPRINFVQLKASDVFSKWFGESEQRLRQAFVTARAKAPCILFIDQVEVLAPKRSANVESGVGTRILSTLLNELDGVDTARDGLIVLGVTSKIESMDEAVLRPGRLGYRVEMPLPTPAEGRSIMASLCANVGGQVDINRLRITGKTGAELCGMFNDACWRALRRRSAKSLIREDFFSSDDDDDKDDDEVDCATPFAYSARESDDESL